MPNIKIGKASTMPILKIFVPIILPIAISYSCFFADISVIESSGKEVPIETIYINNNSMSHFNPVKDSFIIYKLFTSYILSSFSSFIIDLILFLMMFLFSKNIILSTLYSRLISSVWNYFINANLVFKNMDLKSIIMYYILVIIQMFISAISVLFIYNIVNSNILIIKIIVDTVLFFVNYFVQKNIIFIKE